MLGQFLHAGLIAKDRTLGTLTGGVDGQDSQLAALLLQHMNAKLINTRRLACTRHTTDTNADAVAAIGQTLVDDLLSPCLMVGVHALDEGHRL